MTRVFVFGLDAASPILIERWLDDLPNLRKMIQEGTWGNLRSTLPPFTSPAWACMVTGKNPAKVGIFGLRQRHQDDYKFVSPTSDYRHAPAVWDMVGQMGKQVIVVNVPDTYPPTPVNGVMVSGRPAPMEAGASITFPTNIRRQLDHISGGYLVGPPSAFDDESQADEYPVWEDVLARQQRVLEELMVRQDWNLFFYVSMAVDGIGHHFWKYLDPTHPDYEVSLAEKYGDTLHQIYKLEDQRIGRVLERLTPDDLLLIVSDHGSAPCHHHISVNRWLIDHGYLVLRGKKPPQPNKLMGGFARLAFNLYRQAKWARKLAQPLRRTALREAVVHSHFLQNTRGRIPMDALPIDWAKTTAYYLGDDRLYLNVASREPQGCIQPEAYLEKRTELRDALLQARDPEGNQPLFSQVYTREEIYNGPYLEQAPDLILVPGHETWNLGGAVGDVVVDRPVVSGKHHPEGVYVAWGAGVQAGQKLPASIYDIAPTLMYALGLPVPTDGDGQVQTVWFKPTSKIAQHQLEQKNYGEVSFSGYTWTAQEQAQVEERLRELGYLD